MKKYNYIFVVLFLIGFGTSAQVDRTLVQVYPFTSYTEENLESIGSKISETISMHLLLTNRIELFSADRVSYTVEQNRQANNEQEKPDFFIRGEVITDGNSMSIETYVWERETSTNKLFSTDYFNKSDIFFQLEKLSKQISQHIILTSSSSNRTLGITCLETSKSSKALKNSVLKNEIPLLILDGMSQSGFTPMSWSDTGLLCGSDITGNVEIPDLLISGEISSPTSKLSRNPVSTIRIKIYNKEDRKYIQLSKLKLIEDSELSGHDSRNSYVSSKVADVLISDVVNGLQLLDINGEELNYDGFKPKGSNKELLESAKTYFNKNKLYLAAIYVDKVIDNDEKNAQAHSLLAAIRFSQGRYAESNFHEETARKLLSQDRKRDVLVEAGLYYDKGDYVTAIKILRNGYQTYPSDYEISKKIGESFYNLSQLDSAQKYYSRVANNQNATESDKFYYSSVLMLMGEYERAINQLTRLIQLESKNKDTYISSLAQAYGQIAQKKIQSNQIQEGVELAEKSIDFQLNYTALNILIDHSLSIGQFDKADSLLRLGISKQVLNKDEYYYVGMSLYDEYAINKENTDLARYAIDLLNRYDEYLGYSSVATQYAGFLAAEIGDNSEAKASLSAVLKEDPEDAMNYFNLAEVQIVDLDGEGALATLQSAKSHIDPDITERKILSAYLEVMALIVDGQDVSSEKNRLESLIQGEEPIYTTWSFQYFLDSMEALKSHDKDLSDELIYITNQVKDRLGN